MGLLYGENCMILTSTIFDWSTRVTDRRTDRRTDGFAIAYSALSMLSCTNKESATLSWHWCRSLLAAISSRFNDSRHWILLLYSSAAFSMSARSSHNSRSWSCFNSATDVVSCSAAAVSCCFSDDIYQHSIHHLSNEYRTFVMSIFLMQN